jgi:hypothetical protein
MLSVTLLYFLFSNCISPTASAPVHNSSSTPTSTLQILSFVHDPRGRGTTSLVVSSITTLILCVWSGLHLNVPPCNELKRRRMVRQCCWIIVGIYAPELVVFTAWRQWSSARLLGNIVKEVDANEDGVTESEERSDESSGNDEDRDSVTSRHEILSAKQGKPNRRYEGAMTHSFFASTGDSRLRFRREMSTRVANAPNSSPKFLHSALLLLPKESPCLPGVVTYQMC